MMLVLRLILIASILSVGAFTQAFAELPKIKENLNATVMVIGVDSADEIKPKNTTGVGTGVVFTSDGLFVTNWHVIESAKDIEVYVYHKDDDTKYKAEIIGGDKVMDLAVLKIKEPLPPIFDHADWGEDPDIGEDIYMIGHPQGLVWSVSKGIVSHKRRYVNSPWQRMIQTDALLMPGNSGGPLLDDIGQVIGINALIVPSQDRTNTQAWGMSIHVEDVKWSIDRIMAYGKPRRPALNVDASYNDEEKFVLINPKTNSNLQKAGLSGEAKVVTLNDTPIQNFADMYKFLKTKKDGDSVTITVEQQGVVKNYTFNLEVWGVLSNQEEWDSEVETD